MIQNYDCSQIENCDVLRRLQLTQLEILKYVDEFCRNNNINYSLAYGTALGAVRHKGFIPWDDDMDICMLRPDYDRFIELWNDTDKFMLQNHNTEPSFTQSFTKIRKKNTAFIQKTDDLSDDFYKGIFIDVFPFDRVPDNAVKRKIQKLHAMKYNLYTRGYAPKGNKVVETVSNILLKLTRKKKYESKAKKYLDKVCRYNNDPRLDLVCVVTMRDMRVNFKNDLLDKTAEIEFENERFKIFSQYKYFLETYFGDYMKLPPKEEQTWFHHPVYINFEKGDYENEQSL